VGEYVNNSYVNTLEERIRSLEAQIGGHESISATGTSRNVEDASGSSSNQQPMSLSPTSVADSFELELDNTKSLELLEFGTIHFITH
jgi:hypothetical protein